MRLPSVVFHGALFSWLFTTGCSPTEAPRPIDREGAGHRDADDAAGAGGASEADGVGSPGDRDGARAMDAEGHDSARGQGGARDAGSVDSERAEAFPAGGPVDGALDGRVSAGDAAAQPMEGAGVFVAVGYGARRARSLDDGVTWTDDVEATSSGGDDDTLLRTVVWGNGEFVALGWRVMSSPDGKVWNDRGTILGQWIGAATYARGLYVAVGGYGLRMTSQDAISWQHHDIDTAASHAPGGLAYGDEGQGHFVAANDDGRRSYSADGKVWSFATGATSTTTSQLAYGNGTFVGVDGGAVVVSKDGGATWLASATLSAASDTLVFAQGHFTALGVGHVFTSTDGATWEDHPVPNLAGGSLAYGHGTYVLVRDTERRRSKDAIVWEAPVKGGTNAWAWVTFGPSM